MKSDYVQESRRFYALAQTMELLARSLRVQPDRDTAVASSVLADLALAQLGRMDKAIDDMIGEGRGLNVRAEGPEDGGTARGLKGETAPRTKTGGEGCFR